MEVLAQVSQALSTNIVQLLAPSIAENLGVDGNLYLYK